MVIEVMARCSRAAIKDKVERGRKGEKGELLLDMICVPFRLGSVLKLLDCVIMSAYTATNMCTFTQVLRGIAV